MVYKWVASGADPFDIYMEFKKLNERMGYRKDESGDLNNFDETLIKILKVPPPQKDKEG